MWWVVLYVALGVLSIVVLAALSVRLWRQVRQLGREIAVANDRLARVAGELEQITQPRR